MIHVGMISYYIPTSKAEINILLDIIPSRGMHALSELLSSEKFQKALILAFEANRASTFPNFTFLRILEHCAVHKVVHNNPRCVETLTDHVSSKTNLKWKSTLQK